MFLKKFDIFLFEWFVDCWVMKELGRLFTLGQKQTYKWVGYHILIQNLKTVGLWVLLLIKCLISTFSNNVKLLTHTCYNSLPLKCDYIHSCEHAPSQAEAFSSHLHLHLHCRCQRESKTCCPVIILWKTFDTMSRWNPSSNYQLWYNCWVLFDHEGSLYDHQYSAKSIHTRELDITS